MRPQLRAYLFLEHLMIEADDADDDYGHVLRERLHAFWADLTEDEQMSLLDKLGASNE